jgi:hypothetical protein
VPSLFSLHEHLAHMPVNTLEVVNQLQHLPLDVLRAVLGLARVPANVQRRLEVLIFADGWRLQLVRRPGRPRKLKGAKREK